MIIYKVTNKINSMSYIGQTIFDLDKRKNEHISDALSKRDNIYFHRAIRKYGKNNFCWDVIEECDDIEELNKLEIHYIGFYKTFENGYNLKTGGSRGKLSEEICSQIAKKLKGHGVTKETRKKMSEAKKGCVPWNKNIPCSEETKKKIAESHIGKILLEETKLKMSEAHMGKKSSRAKSIILIHLDGLEEKFNCMSDACRKYNLHTGALSYVAKGKQKHHKGFKCKYLN